MTVQWDSGYKQPPSMAYSDVEIFIMDGEMQIGDKLCHKGEYLFVPRGVSIPAFYTQKGCFALVMYNDSEPHIVESDENMSDAETHRFVQLQTYDQMPWQVPTLFPKTASGCLLKLLRFDEKNTHRLRLPTMDQRHEVRMKHERTFPCLPCRTRSARPRSAARRSTQSVQDAHRNHFGAKR